jgi:serine/threonine protein kinase
MVRKIHTILNIKF